MRGARDLFLSSSMAPWPDGVHVSIPRPGFIPGNRTAPRGVACVLGQSTPWRYVGSTTEGGKLPARSDFPAPACTQLPI